VHCGSLLQLGLGKSGNARLRNCSPKLPPACFGAEKFCIFRVLGSDFLAQFWCFLRRSWPSWLAHNLSSTPEVGQTPDLDESSRQGLLCLNSPLFFTPTVDQTPKQGGVKSQRALPPACFGPEKLALLVSPQLELQRSDRRQT